jgi:pSer/pThr/pTyr-binding forkhead associated (FHA) protein
MRLEILIDNEEPRIFPLNKPKILLGSHENCDICISGASVSRKHLAILVEGDSFFVIDQGSTNGSFMNEERMVPGKKVEFTSFFPIRLGNNILLSLLSDEDAANQLASSFESLNIKEDASKNSLSSTETTRSIALSDLQSVTTDKLYEKRAQASIKRKGQPKALPKNELKDTERMLGAKVLGLVILLGAGYWQFFINQPDVAVKNIEKTSTKTKEVAPVEPPKPQFALVDKSFLAPKSKYVDIKQNMNCSTETEKYFCQTLPKVSGAVQVGAKMYVFFEGNDFYQMAKNEMLGEGVREPDGVTPEYREKLRKNLMYMAYLQYFFKAFPKDFDFEQAKNLDLIFVMNINFNGGASDNATLAIVPETLKLLLMKIDSRTFEVAKKYGVAALDNFKEYFHFF